MPKFVTSRYSQNNVITNSDSKIVLNSWTSFNPEDLIDDSDIEVTLFEGDRLDKLAFSYLGNESYYFVICMLNGMKHFWDWKIGQTIRIPSDVNRFFSYIRKNINSN